MITIEEKGFVLYYRYRSLMGPVMGVGMALLALIILVLGEGGVFLSILALFFSIWVGFLFYEKTDFRFDVKDQMLRGRRQRFRKTETFNVKLLHINSIVVERIYGGPTTYRIMLMTIDGPIPLSIAYSSDSNVLDQARHIYTWLKQHGFDIPLDLNKSS